jgi:hypothetical protein
MPKTLMLILLLFAVSAAPAWSQDDPGDEVNEMQSGDESEAFAEEAGDEPIEYAADAEDSGEDMIESEGDNAFADTEADSGDASEDQSAAGDEAADETAQSDEEEEAEDSADKDAAANEARMATLLFRTDADCSLTINGEAQGLLAAGQTKAVKVNPGGQIIDCVSSEFALASISEVKIATAGTQSAVVLQLAAGLQAAAAQQQALRNRYTARGDGTVRDSQTGVIWADHDNGSDIDWNGARNYCASLGGGWSLPTVEQLQALYDSSGTLTQSCKQWTCKVTPSIRLSSQAFWSSGANGSSVVWIVDLVGGVAGSYRVGDADASALCVRRS